jgi:NAD+ synthase
MVEETNEPRVAFSSEVLRLDGAQEVERLCGWLRRAIHQALHRRGAVVGCSGGIDSSVVLALCARALGPERVLAVLLPEKESSLESAVLAQELAQHLGVQLVVEDITSTLEGAGCYQRRDEAVRRVVPEFGPGWKSKITLPGSLLDQATLSVFYVTATGPDGQQVRRRLPPAEYAQIVAASNFKQRARMAMLYYHAEQRHFVVAGTANKNEYDLGFFVKHGDGGVDVSPILHLFKTQVYQLAECLDVPCSIRDRTPTTDTYSAGSTQEEFFFRLPFNVLDAIWASYESRVPAAAIAKGLDLTAEQVERVIDDIVRKQRTTRHLRLPGLSPARERGSEGQRQPPHDTTFPDVPASSTIEAQEL